MAGTTIRDYDKFRLILSNELDRTGIIELDNITNVNGVKFDKIVITKTDSMALVSGETPQNRMILRKEIGMGEILYEIYHYRFCSCCNKPAKIYDWEYNCCRNCATKSIVPCISCNEPHDVYTIDKETKECSTCLVKKWFTSLKV